MEAKRRSFYLWVVAPGVAVPLVVALLFSFPQAVTLGDWVLHLPAVHAGVNAATAGFLLAALWAIKRGRVLLHQRLIYVCLALGMLFLLSYVLYHASVPSTRYGDSNGDGQLSKEELMHAGGLRTFYLSVLLSHILLSISVVYLALMALHHARWKAFDKHRKWVRFAFPVWLYVSISGVVVYFLIRPYYVF